MSKNVGLMLVAGILICLAPATAAVNFAWLYKLKPPKVLNYCLPGRRTSDLCRPQPSPVIDCAAILGICSPYRTGSPAAACCKGIWNLNLADTASDQRAACRCLKLLGSSVLSRCGVRVPYAIIVNTDCSRIG